MPHTILLVEDNPDDLLLIGNAFGKAAPDLALRKVVDGEDAVNYLSGQGAYFDRGEHPLPRLVLLDLRLPKRSGLEVLRWIRSREQLDETPVIILSSSQESSDISQAYALGANSYVHKSLDGQALQDIVKGIRQYVAILAARPAGWSD